ncbi:alpha-L-fucosidase [Alistipes sp.]|uniref:alpha-L-fucosidase n=1 Tax=Alistipes sp. TaxID=1872444 RepID=UPI003AF10FD2
MKRFFLLSALLCLTGRVFAQPQYVPAEENLQAREAFRDAKFGIFIHWGLYALLGTGEWTMTNRNIDYREYAKLADAFYPHRFDAAEWVEAIKGAGARYVCFTSRHHEGFSMFNSEWTDYNIVDATPFGRDVVGELAAECHRQQIGLHLYYSHIDWYREDCPRGRTGLGTGRPNPAGDWPSYYRFMNNQLTELLTRYGKIGAIWFDGIWDQDQNPGFDWQLPGQYALIHKLQPGCLIGNNHHLHPFAGEDIQIFERDLPGENTAGLSGQTIGQLPLETCQTMNGMWGYKITDLDYKPAPTLIRYLVRAAGRNANLLLNIGPQPDGRLPEGALELLREMGQWLARYGETIYGTRGGIVPPRDWGVTTQKGDTLYVHILDLQDDCLYLPLGGKRVKSARKFGTATPVSFRQEKEGVLLRLGEVPDDTDYIVELTLN